MKDSIIKQRERDIRNQSIIDLYKTARFTTEHIARTYGLTTRSVQRMLRDKGAIRTQAESNKLMAPLKRYHRMPRHLKVQRKHISQKVRYATIKAHPYCTDCGARPDDGIRLEVDHIDENPTNNALDNLQVLCQPCNLGKSHINRFGLAA